MSMLLYMPWCRIDRTYNVDKITILPFERATQPVDVDDGTWCRIRAILDTHRDINGNPVDRAALVQFSGKALTDDLSDEEIDTVGGLVMLACFAGVASREYFNFMPNARYCNSDCFTFYVQKFDISGFTAISTRRRDGRTLSGWSLDKVSISIPAHCHTIKEVTLDRSLLGVLSDEHKSLRPEEWGRWQNSITCFNLANTDSETFREHVEWVLLCGAFEHLLDARSKAKDVARLFDETIVPASVLPASGAVRLTSQQITTGNSVRYEWMQEFYRVRSDFAHGKLVSQQPMAWKSYEHLVLATIAFPLVIKSLLVGAGGYRLTKDDHVQIDCFEALADTPGFSIPPQNAESSWDSKWGRLLEKRTQEINSEWFRSECMKDLAAQEHGGDEQPEETK